MSTAAHIVDLATSGADGAAKRLAAAPHVRRVPSPKLQQFIIPRWLDAGVCAALVDQIDASVRPSTIADPNGDDNFRTSETCDLNHDDAVVRALDDRLAALTGIDPAFGEPLQGQRYDVGQQFKGHTDYFEPGGLDYDRYCAVSGQRTWTLMIYLNVPNAGGATRFLSTGKIHQPELGKLLAWNNVGADGLPNPETMHAGMPVRSGRKYVITKWYRERAWPW
jgi:prolyl 4-hydroxylase